MKSGCTPANYHPPVHTYPSGPDVVIGGYVVRDPDLPAFAGRYLFGRLNTGIYQLEANGSATQKANVAALSAFGEDGVGHLYATSLTGPVYRLSQNGSNLVTTSIGSFDQPLAVTAPTGETDRLFVVQKTGIVKLRTGTQVSDFLDLSSLITTADGEQGLLAFALAPDYATSGRVFAYYTNKSNDLQLDEFRRSATGPDRSDLATRRPILTIQHDQAQNHNGGQLLFGRDGMLYLSTGDGGTQNDPEGDAQSLASLLGKIIRIDVGIPPAAVDTVGPQPAHEGQGPSAPAASARGDRLPALQRELLDRGRRPAARGQARVPPAPRALAGPRQQARPREGAARPQGATGDRRRGEATPQDPDRRDPPRPRRDRQSLDAGHPGRPPQALKLPDPASAR